MTPYLAKVQEQPGAESQLCCLLLAERVHSGYEGTATADQERAQLLSPRVQTRRRRTACWLAHLPWPLPARADTIFPSLSALALPTHRRLDTDFSPTSRPLLCPSPLPHAFCAQHEISPDRSEAL